MPKNENPPESEGQDLYSAEPILRATLERAKDGNLQAALSLLRIAKSHLEVGAQLPPALADYLASAFNQIANSSTPAQEAAEALHLGGRRGRRADPLKEVRDTQLVWDLADRLEIEMEVPKSEALRGERSPLTRAVRYIEDKYDLSERQIYRIVKPYLARKEDH